MIFRLAIFVASRPAAKERQLCEVLKLLIRKNLIHEPSEGFVCVSPSRTQQQFKEECDVNTILRNFVDTGVLTHTSGKTPVFGDFTEMPADYGEALALLNKSREEFAKLPSAVRDRFDNRPENMISFIKDDKNYDEALKLGLVKERVKAEEKL